MLKRVLGKTGLEVAPIGFGGIPIQRVNDDDAIKIIHTTIDKGINFIDSARGYTDSEVKIGKAIKDRRDKVILATKSMARNEKDIQNDIEISLRNFQTDYIDLYQLHNVKTEEDAEKVFAPNGALNALIKAKEAGKIGHIGITSHSAEIALKCLEKFSFETIQFPRNFVEDQAEKELFPFARENNIGIIVMKPLAGGALQNAKLALRYLLGLDFSVIIPGMDSVKQVIENSDLMKNYLNLTKEELEQLKSEREKLGNEFCRRCEYCLPCPQGIDIPSCFLFLGYHERYNLQAWAQDRYNASPVKASECIECGTCEERCPYDLPIRKMLKRVQESFE